MVFKVENLAARYNTEAEYIFENVNFELNAGDFILLTGLSGCGKSTLLKTLNGILQGEDLVSGKILIDDIDIINKSASERSEYIASVLQNADEQIIFEKVEDELAFPLENINLDPTEMAKRIDKYSTMMQINKNDRTSKLSGGQKQSLITAASFGMERKILLFDEPLANLDNKAAISLLDTLKKFCEEENYIVLFSEHRIDLVLDYTNKVFYMNDGKLTNMPSCHSEISEISPLRSATIEMTDSCHLERQVQCHPERREHSERSRTDLTSSSNNKEVVFDIQDLHFTVAKKDIIKGINYKFYQGGKYVILGENGCGKSTLIKLITGIYKPTKGKIITDFTKKDRFQKIGLVMQNPNYQLFMPSVEAELKLQAKDDDFLQYLIDIFKLDDILQAHPHSLSEGQKRRVGVAAILSMMPEVLILDEPSVGQDYHNMSAMISAIQELCKLQETTVISISHDLRCMDSLGDVFVTLQDGVLS